MSYLYVDGKIFSLGGKFWVTDDNGNNRYEVRGSFAAIPKRFYIYDTHDDEVARLTHVVLSLLPRFTLEIGGKQAAVIQQKFSPFKPKYDIHAEGVKVEGNIWDMNFDVTRDGTVIGDIDKKWVTVRDSYKIEVRNPADELLVLGIVLAINYVKDQRRAI